VLSAGHRAAAVQQVQARIHTNCLADLGGLVRTVSRHSRQRRSCFNHWVADHRRVEPDAPMFTSAKELAHAITPSIVTNTRDHRLDFAPVTKHLAPTSLGPGLTIPSAANSPSEV